MPRSNTVVAYKNKQGRCFKATPILAKLKTKLELEALYSMPVELQEVKAVRPKQKLLKEVEEAENNLDIEEQEHEQMLQAAFAPKKRK